MANILMTMQWATRVWWLTGAEIFLIILPRLALYQPTQTGSAKTQPLILHTVGTFPGRIRHSMKWSLSYSHWKCMLVASSTLPHTNTICCLNKCTTLTSFFVTTGSWIYIGNYNNKTHCTAEAKCSVLHKIHKSLPNI